MRQYVCVAAGLLLFSGCQTGHRGGYAFYDAGTGYYTTVAERDTVARAELAADRQPIYQERFAPERAAVPTQELQTEDEMIIPLREENLRVGTREVDAGGVTIRRIVRSKEVSEPLDLRREDVIVERVQPGQQTSPGLAREAQEFGAPFQEGEIYIPLRREEPVVSRDSRIAEEVRVRRIVETDRQIITDVIRREDLEVVRTQAGEAPAVGAPPDTRPQREMFRGPAVEPRTEPRTAPPPGEAPLAPPDRVLEERDRQLQEELELRERELRQRELDTPPSAIEQETTPAEPIIPPGASAPGAFRAFIVPAAATTSGTGAGGFRPTPGAGTLTPGATMSSPGVPAPGGTISPQIGGGVTAPRGIAPGQFHPGAAPGQFQPGVAPGQFQPGQIQQPGVARGAFGTQPGVVTPGVTSPGLLPPGTVTPGQAPPGRPLPGAPLPRTAAPRVGDPITPGTVTPGTPGATAIPGRPGTFVGPQGTGTAFPRAPLPGEVQPTVPGPGAISPQAPFPGQIQPTVPGPDAIRPQPPGAEFPGAPVPETFTPAPGLGVPMAGEIQARQQAADRALAQRIHTSVARPTTGPSGVITTPRVTNLQVASQRGVVTLRGTVTTPQERQMIGRQVERMPGVWGVNNEIQVVAPGIIPR